MLFKLEIGDYSEDGYGVHEPVIYETNYCTISSPTPRNHPTPPDDWRTC